ncbi:MAG: type II secretion system F family protein [Nanoarchaeota archaeon]|nr:type II secretion system F family protein [Nanoarchaeota archaeon]
MKFRVPFTFASTDKLKKRSVFFRRFIKKKKNTKLEIALENAEVPLNREEYLSICLGGFVVSFFMMFIVISTLLILVSVEGALLLSLVISLMLSAFMYFSRVAYPSIYNHKKQVDLERNLIPALQDMLVQLNSGVPMFSIMVNISSTDYGELSKQFKVMVKEINAGMPQVEVLERIGDRNPSEYFRRALWQMSNGLRAGSDITVVIEDTVKSLIEEQYIQIQDYGNKLNPAIMFYMLSSVILPALAITFLTLITSMIDLGSTTSKLIFVGMFIAVMFAQVMFLGVIKSMRPSLI